jgi:hypothetical protein
MSEILQRMIARARSPLSSVEPLHAPRFVEGPAGGETLPIEHTNVEEIIPDAITAFPGASKEGTTAPEIQATATNGVARTPGDGSKTALSLSTEQQLGSVGNSKILEVGRELQSVSPSETRPENKAQPSRKEEVETRPERAADKRVPVETATARNPVVPKAEPSLPPRQEPTFPRTRGKGSANPEVEARTVNREPIVTISIGQIEVRAAQTVERPRKAPFRPKVSLADFLSRKQGGSRE